MASSTSSSSKRLLNVDEKNLKTLLNEFGSVFPLEEIASAFCAAGQNAELTSQILYNRMQASNNVGQEEISEISSQSSNSSGNMDPPSRYRDANFGASKIQRTPIKSDKHWVVKKTANSSSSGRVVSQLDEYEDFLFKMLQHGFCADRDVIRRVLGRLFTLSEVGYIMKHPNERICDGECGCDMKKSLEKLIDLAAEKHYSKNELRNEGKIHDTNLTSEAERTSLLPRIGIEESETEEQDCDYDTLRKAVKEYRATMNEYYKSATEAYTIGDQARSIMLLKKGELFYRKAREADELSAKRIYSPSSVDEEEEGVPLNLENCMPKESVRLLKSHLRNFSGIASIKHIRVINGTQEEDASLRASRMQLVLKLLKSEAIKWSEDKNSGDILVMVVEVNPQDLSFAKNYRGS